MTLIISSPAKIYGTTHKELAAALCEYSALCAADFKGRQNGGKYQVPTAPTPIIILN
jgi:hypothetical protein